MIDLAAGGSIQDGVAGDNLRRIERGVSHGLDGDRSAGHTLADIVVGFAFESSSMPLTVKAPKLCPALPVKPASYFGSPQARRAHVASAYRPCHLGSDRPILRCNWLCRSTTVPPIREWRRRARLDTRRRCVVRSCVMLIVLRRTSSAAGSAKSGRTRACRRGRSDQSALPRGDRCGRQSRRSCVRRAPPALLGRPPASMVK